MHIEQEIKLAIKSKSDLKTLLKVLPSPKDIVEQKNVFFTIKQAAKKIIPMFRVRIMNEQLYITVKKNTQSKDGIFTTEETEYEINNEDRMVWESWALCESQNRPPLPQNIRKAFGIEYSNQPMYCLGSFTNKRHIIQTKWGKLELDITTFSPDDIEYELELETDEESIKNEIENFLINNDVSYTYQEKTKFKRFCERL